MANKKKIEFSVAAVAMTMQVFPELPRESGVDDAVLESFVAYDRANKWMLPSLRKTLRNSIELSPERLKVYEEALQEVKDNYKKVFKYKEWVVDINCDDSIENINKKIKEILCIS